jgi:Uma2 family endonuclease
MQMLLEITDAPKKLIIEPRLSDEAFERLCLLNADLPLERTREGEIVVNAPAGFDGDESNTEFIYQLKAWAKRQGGGRVVGATAGFFLPDGSCLSPDAAYLTPEQSVRLRPGDRKGFLRTVPAFVAEVRSRSDALGAAKTKMRRWLENGVELAWLLDPKSRSVYVFEAGRDVRVERGITVAGSGPLSGFVLDASEVWELYDE